jgi:hypothetical protein
MGGFSLTSLIAAGALMGAVAFDVTVNAVQDWYQIMYADAFWANRVSDSPALRDLTQEEAQINALLRTSAEFSSQQVVIPEQDVVRRILP